MIDDWLSTCTRTRLLGTRTCTSHLVFVTSTSTSTVQGCRLSQWLGLPSILPLVDYLEIRSINIPTSKECCRIWLLMLTRQFMTACPKHRCTSLKETADARCTVLKFDIYSSYKTPSMQLRKYLEMDCIPHFALASHSKKDQRNTVSPSVVRMFQNVRQSPATLPWADRTWTRDLTESSG